MDFESIIRVAWNEDKLVGGEESMNESSLLFALLISMVAALLYNLIRTCFIQGRHRVNSALEVEQCSTRKFKEWQ
jgi:hypothetical protein